MPDGRYFGVGERVSGFWLGFDDFLITFDHTDCDHFLIIVPNTWFLSVKMKLCDQKMIKWFWSLLITIWSHVITIWSHVITPKFEDEKWKSDLKISSDLEIKSENLVGPKN